ncbi:MAG: alanine racemase [Pseudomonadota bacterium]
MPIHHPTIDEAEALRPTHIEIDLEAICDNYRSICAHVGHRPTMAVIKANAYGHGLVEVARRLEKDEVPYFGVAFLEEGIKLRKAGITTPILVMGGILGDQIPLFLEHDLTLTASSVDKLAQIESFAKQRQQRAKVHVKIDTGMERIGVHYYSAEPLILASGECRWCEIEGIFTHFASSDEDDMSYTRVQLERFLSVCELFDKHGLPTPVRHAANSGAIAQFPDANLDLVRPGRMLFGVSPTGKAIDGLPLRTAMNWKSRVVYFKVVKPGHPVSYGSTWQTDKNTRVVTVPVGYGDGYFRNMSGRAEVVIGGKRYPVVGRICMDQIMIDIGDDSAFNGDSVLLLGKDGDASITVENLAEWANTIPLEVLTNINTRVPRVYR